MPARGTGALAAASKGNANRTGAMRRIRLPFAVIGVVRKDRCRAEQLFGKHRPDEQVRPGPRPERKQQVGAAPVVVIVSAVRADKETRLAFAVVAPSFELARKLRRRQRLAALI